MEAIQIQPVAEQFPLQEYLTSNFIIDDDPYEFSEAGRAVSEKEYWEKYYSHLSFAYEWNNGYLEVKPMAGHDGIVLYTWFFELLIHFLTTNPIAKHLAIETAFKPSTKKKKSIRKPDLGVILNTNPVPFVSGDLSYYGICDICIEFLSYSSSWEIRRDTVVKKKEYEAAGVKEYFILDDRGIDTYFFRLNRFGIYENIKPFPGNIICSEVLPGFQFRISDLYTQPSAINMTKDEVYYSYVLPQYRMQAIQLNQAEKLLAKSEAEKQILMKKLKELGILPDELLALK